MEKLILLVDDDEDELLLLNEAVRTTGMDVLCTWASDADKAFHLLQQVKPDIILLDLNMPRVNGLACLAQIRTLPSVKTTPVVLYSTSISDHARQKAFEWGAVDCVEKTASLSALAGQLTKLLNQVPSA